MAPLSLERRDSIFVLQLGDGENRFDRRLLDELERALDEVEQSGEPAALITVGSGRFYSNGYDRDWLAEQGRDARRVFIRDYQLLLARLLVFPMPTVAAISGHAFGAGALLALAHDRRLACEDRGYFCLPEIDARIPLRRGMVALLASRLGPSGLRDVVLRGERYAGEAAVAIGLAQKSAPQAAILARACRWAASRAGRGSAITGELKRALYAEALALLQGRALD